MSVAKLLDAHAEKVSAAKQALEERQATLVAKHHPLKHGQKVKATGWSHHGKEMIVSSIWVRRRHKGWEWFAKGTVLKKDGTPGKQNGEWTQPV